MSTDKKKEVWLAAYNAAVTGFLASGREISKPSLRAGCVEHANNAVADFEGKWHADTGPVEVQIATSGRTPRVSGSIHGD